jgi:hypothetical protein
MKKIIAALALLCVLAASAFGQTDLLNVNTYFTLFNIRRSADIVESDYVWAASDDEILGYGVLNWNGRENDDTGLVDIPIEFALLSYYSQSVLNIRPVEADTILPANNPRLAGLRLGAALYQDIQVLRFLATNQAVERYEGMLRFVCDRNGVTRAEIEAFYRNNIRALVSQVVDEEFGKAGQDGIVPAQVYADWERQGIVRVNGRAVNGIELIKQVLGDFFLNPTEANYIRVRGIIARILEQGATSYTYVMDKAFADTITSISPELMSNIRNSWGNGAQGIYAAARQPNDPAFRIFEIPYAVGGR